jgi:hypothetical protein
MRKSLLFGILVLSITSFTQSFRPISNSKDYLEVRLQPGEKKVPAINSDINAVYAIQHKIPKQRDLIQINDSMYLWRWDTVSLGWDVKMKYTDMMYDSLLLQSSYIEKLWNGTVWQTSYKMTNSFDANHNMTHYTSLNWNGSDWVNSWQYTYTYDVNNNQTSCLYTTWNDSVWKNSWRYTYTYDVNNNKTGYMYSSWDGSDWFTFWQYTYTYDPNNYQTGQIYQHWDGISLVNNSKYDYTYDQNNNLIRKLQQAWNDSAWENYNLESITYNASNNPTSGTLENWHINDWVNFIKYSYTYDASYNMIRFIELGWNGSSWGNSWQDIYSYDANHNETSRLGQIGNGSTWLNSMQFSASYDNDNFMKSHTDRSWNNAGTKVKSGDSIFYYYHTMLGLNDQLTLEKGINVYPNPNDGKFSLKSEINDGSVEIYNLLGELIYSNDKFNNQQSIDLSSQPKGLYVIQLNGKNTIYKKKIIIQ